MNWGVCRQPDKVIIRYEAGAKLAATESTLNDIAGQWDIVIARLAAAEMPSRDIASEQANMEIHRWQKDIALTSGRNEELYNLSEDDRNNPFGTKAGHIYAWRKVKNLQLTYGFAI